MRCRPRRIGLIARLAAVLPLLAAVPAVVHAQVNLPIVNAGFEDPVQGANAFTSTGINGWTNSGTSGVWRPIPPSYFNVAPPEGSQIGYANSSSVAQALTSVLQTGQYVLSTQVGHRTDGFTGDLGLELWAGGTVASGVVTGGTLLASGTLTVAQQTLGQFTPLSVPFTAAAGNPRLGQTLAIRIVDLNGSQADFDQVALIFTAAGTTGAPEPGALALLSIGLLSLAGSAALRRRQTASA